MKPRLLVSNKRHLDYMSYVFLVYSIEGKRVCIKHEATNAVERHSTSVFNGNEFTHVLCMDDLGIKPETSAYNIWDAEKRKQREQQLTDIAISIITLILKP